MRDRTADLLRARQALSQLSYSPTYSYQCICKRSYSRQSGTLFSLLNEFRFNAEEGCLVGQGRLELPTSPLSGVRSNQLSYRPTTFSFQV